MFHKTDHTTTLKSLLAIFAAVHPTSLSLSKAVEAAVSGDFGRTTCRRARAAAEMAWNKFNNAPSGPAVTSLYAAACAAEAIRIAVESKGDLTPDFHEEKDAAYRHAPPHLSEAKVYAGSPKFGPG